MRTRVKYWVVGCLIILLIIACVVMYAMYGEVVLPGEDTLSYSQSYQLDSYVIKNRANLTDLDKDVDYIEDYTEKQSLAYYGNYLNTVGFRFSQNQNVTVTGMGEASAYEFSKNGTDVSFVPKGAVYLPLKLENITTKIKKQQLTLTLNLGNYTGQAVFSAASQNMNVDSKTFVFSDYSLIEDDTATDKLSKPQINHSIAGMKEVLRDNWIRFRATSGGNGQVNFYTGDTSDPSNSGDTSITQRVTWNYSTSGNCLILKRTDSLSGGVERMLATVEDDRITIENISKNYKETVTYITGDAPVFTIFPTSLNLTGKVVNFSQAKVVWPAHEENAPTVKISRIREMVAEGRYTTTDAGDITAFENYAKNTDLQVADVPTKIAFLPKQMCEVTLRGETAPRIFSYRFMNNVSGEQYLVLKSKGLPTISAVGNERVSVCALKISTTGAVTTFEYVPNSLLTGYVDVSFSYTLDDAE